MKLLITCLAENNASYHLKVITLFQSIRENGGKLNEAIKIVHFIGGVDEWVKEYLAEQGIRTRIVDPIDIRSPHSNKIRMLEVEEQYDVMLMLDCDTAITCDFSDHLTTEAIMAKPTNTHTLELDMWRNLFRYFEVPFPAHRIRTTFSYVYTVPYFNSGFIAVPQKYASQLYGLWKKWAVRLLDSYSNLEKEIQDEKFYTDQFALTLSLSENHLPYFVLGIEYNFSTHHPKTDRISSEVIPYVLHYHFHITQDGLLKKTEYPLVDLEIDKINEMIERNRLYQLVNDKTS